ncbi:MAG: hypothetical protein M1268_01255 [Patescibacteria group bacterium]|nr:hypothetical protein [Patescibacteria group bacterium]
MEIIRTSLYTQETIVFRSGLENTDTLKPISVYEDLGGNQAIADGNHRAYNAYIRGALSELPREIIGKISKDVSKDPNYRVIAELDIIDK